MKDLEVVSWSTGLDTTMISDTQRSTTVGLSGGGNVTYFDYDTSKLGWVMNRRVHFIPVHPDPLFQLVAMHWNPEITSQIESLLGSVSSFYCAWLLFSYATDKSAEEIDGSYHTAKRALTAQRDALMLAKLRLPGLLQSCVIGRRTSEEVAEGLYVKRFQEVDFDVDSLLESVNDTLNFWSVTWRGSTVSMVYIWHAIPKRRILWTTKVQLQLSSWIANLASW